MRDIRTGTRIAGLAVLLAGVLSASACSSGEPGAQATPSASAAVTATASAAPTDLPGNTKAVCTEVRTLVTDGAAQFTRKLADAISSTQSGGAAGDAAVKQIKDLLAQWAAGLRDQAAIAVDPNLRTALATEADTLDHAAAKINTPRDLTSAGSILTSPEVSQAGQAVQQACGAYWGS